MYQVTLERFRVAFNSEHEYLGYMETHHIKEFLDFYSELGYKIRKLNNHYYHFDPYRIEEEIIDLYTNEEILVLNIVHFRYIPEYPFFTCKPEPSYAA